MSKKFLVVSLLSLSLIGGLMTGCGKKDMTEVKTETNKTQEKTESGKSISELIDLGVYECINGESKVEGIIGWMPSEMEDGVHVRIDINEKFDTKNEEKVKKSIEKQLKDVLKNRTLTVEFEKAE